MRRGTAILAALAIACVILGPTPALAHHENPENHHWPGDGVRTVTVEDNTTTATWADVLLKAVTRWNGGLQRVHLALVDNQPDGQTGQTSCAFTFPAQTVVVCNRTTASTWFGLTSIFQQNGHFTTGLIELSDNRAPGGSWSFTKRRHVVCHELGHALGVGHRYTENGTCMDDNWAADASRFPDAHDIAAVDKLHAHDD